MERVGWRTGVVARGGMAAAVGMILGAVTVGAATGVVRPTAAGAAPSVTSPKVDTPTGATRDADNGRTGWYPDQPGLTPGLVTSGSFGQRFSTSLNGQVYGQPLVEDGQLLVVTETNYAYGLDPTTGAILWTRHFGNPVQASDLGCTDLAPDMGITSTPVVDTATNTEYVVDNQYVSGTSGASTYDVQALNLANHGAEEPGFPVQIEGTAANEPTVTFDATYENQRTGLLLLNGSVYAAFAGHCDTPTYYGFVAGVSESGHLTTLWAASGAGGSSAAGIWQSGGGLVSDGTNTMLLATGNGMNGATNTGPIPGTSPPANFGQSVVRLTVQSNGSLEPTDFFSPFNATSLDPGDLDFGSGSPIALPSPYFGTASVPHLAVAVGKEGYVYLLNRDNLGGIGEGPGGTDARGRPLRPGRRGVVRPDRLAGQRRVGLLPDRVRRRERIGFDRLPRGVPIRRGEREPRPSPSPAIRRTPSGSGRAARW